jgi:tetratricopeptide (TPR) repeat protein
MKRLLPILFLLLVMAPFQGLHGQKSRVLSVFQMIDQGKYEDAKESIELAIWNDKTSRWPRTYFAKGLLCQTAWEEGYKEKDKKKTTLYPGQLFVAYRAYERALELDLRERLELQISQKYYSLSNNFRKLGSDHFAANEFEKALEAFEQALKINNSKLVAAPVDTNLVYNAAIAAYESKKWDKAIVYLTGLHEDAHKPSTSLLLHNAYVALGDIAMAHEVLLDAVEIYEYENQIVVYLVNLFVKEGNNELAIKVLNDAIRVQPDNFRFHWSRGLVYRREGEPLKAIEDFKRAAELAPDEAKIYYHIGVVYYNMGIARRDEAREVHDNNRYRSIKKEEKEFFTEAVSWLEKSYDLNPFDENTIERLHQLYVQLDMEDKEKSIRLLIR